LTALLQESGFKLISGGFSSKSVLTEIPIELRESNLNLNIEAKDIIRTLGVEWSPSDEFQLTAQACATTKCKVLSAIVNYSNP